jgi:8-oxo-dGTP pyrophosphatase MutT (NUDIX family)
MASQRLPEFSKVICYIIVGNKVLVFRQRDFSDAGIQVPAGTVDAGEEPSAAAMREAAEETGQSGLEVVAKVGEMDYVYDRPGRGERPRRLELHHRHFFVFRPTDMLPERWSHYADHSWFEFEWMSVDRAAELTAEQGAMLNRALEYVQGDT